MLTALIITLIISYLLGSISPSFLAGKLIKGIDLRDFGSGNLGFTNAMRILGKGPGIVVLFLDVFKGYAAIWTASYLAHYFNQKDYLILLQILAGITVILGHMYTCFHNFSGGKGVATGLGVFLHLSPAAVGGAFIIWGLTVFISGYVSLGSIIAAVSLPLFILIKKLYFSTCCNPVSNWLIFMAALIALGIIYKHIPNIKRILAGAENRVSWGLGKR